MKQKTKLPEGWQETEFGNKAYFEILPSGIDKFEGEKDYLSTESIQGTDIEKIECKITHKDRPSRANMQPVLNSVWFAKMQATLKVYSFTQANKDEINGFILSTGFAGIRVEDSKVDPFYLRHFLKSKEFNKIKDSNCSGATQKAIGNEKLSKIKIPLPSLSIQKKIVKLLDRAEQAKIKRERADNLTKDYLQSVFYDLFFDKKNKFQRVEIQHGITKTENRTPEREFPNEYFEYIDIASVDNKLKKIIETKKILGKEAPSRARQEVKFKDILISTVRPNLNAVALIPKSLDKSICSTGFCILRADNENFVSEYLFNITQTDYFINNLVKKCTGANYPAVSNNDIKCLEVPLPPIELQQKFAKIVEKVEKLKNKQQKSKEKIDEIFTSLMQKAFRGELVK